jgi:hypothetical protein
LSKRILYHIRVIWYSSPHLLSGVILQGGRCARAGARALSLSSKWCSQAYKSIRAVGGGSSMVVKCGARLRAPSHLTCPLPSRLTCCNRLGGQFDSGVEAFLVWGLKGLGFTYLVGARSGRPHLTWSSRLDLMNRGCPIGKYRSSGAKGVG